MSAKLYFTKSERDAANRAKSNKYYARICKCCLKEKTINNFYVSKDKRSKKGVILRIGAECKNCLTNNRREYLKGYRIKNIEKIRLQDKERFKIHQKEYDENRRNKYKICPIREILKNAKSRAKKKKLEFILVIKRKLI